jgi:hypothetical protein
MYLANPNDIDETHREMVRPVAPAIRSDNHQTSFPDGSLRTWNRLLCGMILVEGIAPSCFYCSIPGIFQ